MIFAKKCVAIWIALAAIALAPATRAQEIKPAEGPKPATIDVTPNGTEVHVGDKVQFSAVAKDAAGKVLDVKPEVWFAAPI